MYKFLIKNILYSIAVCLACYSCGNNNNETSKPKPLHTDELVRINKFLVDKDAGIIKAYLKRRNWEMSTSETGLWYMIYQKGAGPLATTGKKVSIKYSIWLLDGTLCYTSDSLGLKNFTIGKGGVERGLEEGILLMHVGDKARFIMPPHLAHGLTGDDDRIPPRSIILYDVELIQITD